VPIDMKDADKNTFIVRTRTYRFRRVPFGRVDVSASDGLSAYRTQFLHVSSSSRRHNSLFHDSGRASSKIEEAVQEIENREYEVKA